MAEASDTVSPETGDDTQASQAAGSSESATIKARVLVVDDDESIRRLLSHFLSKAGYQVEQACNGQEAISLMATAPVDLLLMDIEMPIMDGLRTLGALRRNPSTKDLPVIMLSGQASSAYVKKAIAIGTQSFVVKQNLKPEVVIDRIQQALAATKAKQADTGQGQEEEELIDQALWKEKMEKIGRASREKTKEALDAASLPILFPPMHDEIREAIQSCASDADKEDLIRALEQDPAMMITTLRSATVSQESTNTNVLDMETAISWVGNSGVEEILDQLIKNETPIQDEMRPWMLRWWRHTIAVSQIAAELAIAFGVEQGLARAAGMIHDIGRLMLLHCDMGPKAVAVYDMTRGMAIATIYAEQTLLGINHKQIGAEICNRFALSERLTEVCNSHDVDDAQRARLGEQAETLSVVINAADLLAKSMGYGSLLNDELTPLPERAINPINELQIQIDRAVAEVETLCLWRIGGQSTGPALPEVKLAGITVAFVSPMDTESNPYRKVLQKAGATIVAFADIKDLLDAQPAHDALVLDYTDTNLNLGLALVRRVTQHKFFAKIPQLLLSRRSDEAEDRLSQSGITSIKVYPTPIRSYSLLKTVKRLIS